MRKSQAATVIVIAALAITTGLAVGTNAQTCDATVSSGDSIQAAIDGASDGETICVEDGSYDEDVSVDVPNLTLEGPNNGTAGDGDRDAEATITGQLVVSADGILVDGFEVTPPNPTTNDEGEALRISQAPDDVAVRNNVVHDFNGSQLPDWEGADAIVAFGGDANDPIRNVTITRNKIQAIQGNEQKGGATGISIQGNVENATVQDNVVDDVGMEATGWAFGLVVRGTGNHDQVPANVDLAANDVTRVTSNTSTDTVGVGIGSEANASAMTVTNNTVTEVELLVENKDTDHELDVTENWWGDENGPDTDENPLETSAAGIGGDGDVAYTPWLDAPADQGGELTAPVENVDQGTFHLGIQAAVEAASQGDTLAVLAGTFVPSPQDRIAIDTPGLELTAAGDQAPTVRFEHDENNPGYPTIDILADGVRVDGFLIQREVDPSVYDGSERHAQAVKIGGFSADGGSNAVVTNNTIEFLGNQDEEIVTYGVGIVDAQNGGSVTGVEVGENAIDGFENGVGVFGDIYGAAVGATVHNNTVRHSVDVGVLTFGTVDNLGLSDNELRENGVQVDDGAGALDLDTVLDENTFDNAVVVRENPIKVPKIFSSIQDAVDAAEAGDTVEVEAGTYEEVVRLTTPDLTLDAREGAHLEVDSASAKNHHPALQAAADGVLVRDLTVTRTVDDPATAASGHTKAVGVSFDRSGGEATDAGIELRNLEISLVDETGGEDFGNAVWVSDNNALGGDRANITLHAEGLEVDNEVERVPEGSHEGFGGAALAVYENNERVDVTAVENSFTSIDRGLYLAGTPTVTANYNDLSDVETAFANDGNQRLVAPYNFHGDCDVSVEGEVHVDPVLTVPPADLLPDPLSEGVHEFGVCAEIPANSVTALSTPGPQEESLSEVFESFTGTAFLFNETQQRWEPADGDEVLGAMEPVLVVNKGERVTARLTFPDEEPAEPTERTVQEGWNFIGPRTFADAEIGFSTATVNHTDLVHAFEEPAVSAPLETTAGAHYAFASDESPPMVSPFTGFFVFSSEAGTVPGAVTSAPTHADFYDAMGLPADAVAN